MQVPVNVPEQTVVMDVPVHVPAQDIVMKAVPVVVPAFTTTVEVADPAPPAQKAGWGAYSGATTAEDDAFAAMVGKRQRYANTYYQASRTTLTQMDLTDRPSRGTISLISVNTKGIASGGTSYTPPGGAAANYMLWRDIAAGKFDAFWTAWGNSIAKCAGDLIYVTLDQEPEVRLNQKTVPTQNMTDYAAAWRRVRNIIKPLAPKAKFMYWIGGSDRQKITDGYPGAGIVDLFTYDPYTWASHPATERPQQCWGDFATWIRAQTWYGNEPLALSETGVDIAKFGDVMAADWWSKAPAAADALDLRFVNLFNRVDGASVWKIDSYPRVVAAYSAAVKTMA